MTDANKPNRLPSVLTYDSFGQTQTIAISGEKLSAFLDCQQLITMIRK
jgi:hypothetical protein